MIDKLFDLTGKIALVTGGSRGLGREMVMAFAEHGADVIITSRKIEACEEVAAEVRKLGRKALAIATHVAKWNECDALVDKVYKEWGRVDILVNNAGMGPKVASHEVTEDLWDKVQGVNLKGPFRLASLIAKRMQDGAGGSILNISSTGGSQPLPEVVPYGCAKAGLNHLTLCLAHEYGPKVRVNTISAGPFLTDISKAWPAEQRESQPNAAGRAGQPNEIVGAALYLVSPSASFTTGANFNVDGGQWNS
jgi:NAD(P)-dependent dehydrogenase (short-subunit alcohol dehydrogenase family)